MSSCLHCRRPATTRQRGLGLVEFMVAGLAGTMLLAVLVQVAAGARSSFALQEAIAELQDGTHFAVDSIGAILRQTGFDPEPWLDAARAVGVAAGSGDAVTADSDRIVLRTWSDRNCFDTLNPARDAQGRPRFYLRESVLEKLASDNLALTCRYGPGDDELVTQIPRQGLLPGVEAFQALYAEDLDGDAAADRWVRGGGWSDIQSVLGVQVALLLASRETVADPVSRTWRVLDQDVRTPADGRLRRVITMAHAIRGSLP